MSADRRYGFSVRIFIPSGDPEGIKIIEKSNWIGQGVAFPRALFAEVRLRPELQRTGVYILWGPGDEGHLPRAYVGEGDGTLGRLESHARSKDFWTHALVFSSKDQSLNKAHVQYLESRLIELANAAKRCELDNGNQPALPSLSEAEMADAEAFLADMLMCLPVVGLSLFEKPEPLRTSTPDLILKGKGVEPRGVSTPQGFVVRAGSMAVREVTGSIQPFLVELRHSLLKNGVLVEAGDAYRMTQDYTFSSPSTAAGVIRGASTSGRVEWKDATGRTLKELQELEAIGS